MVLHKKPLQKRFSRQGLGPYNRKIRSRVDFLNPLIGGKLDPGNPGVSTDFLNFGNPGVHLAAPCTPTSTGGSLQCSKAV